MAGNLIPLDEAAKMLGISPDDLNELRQQQKIYGYRDGANWKFKAADIDRYKRERSGGGDLDDSAELIDLEDGDLADSGELISPNDSSEIQLDSADDIRLDSSSGDIDLRSSSADDVSIPSASSSFDINVDDLDLDSSTDDIPLTESTKAPSAGGSAVTLEFDSTEATIEQVLPKSSSSASGPRDLMPTDETFAVAGDPKTGKSRGEDQGSIHSSDDELVLGAPEGGSDITLSPGDSGISLVASDDSGLSLDKPLMLGISADSGPVNLDDSTEFDSSASVELKADDDFLLQPLEEATDESTDSGSQVIALDSSGGFDSATDLEPGALAPQDSGLLEEMEPSASSESLSSFEPAVAAAAPAKGAMAPVRETQFSTLNIVSLTLCVVFLAATGICMYDLLRNMWSWEEPYALNSTIMDLILQY